MLVALHRLGIHPAYAEIGVLASAAVIFVCLELVHEIRVFKNCPSHLEKRKTVFKHLARVLSCGHSAHINERIVRHCRLELERILHKENDLETITKIVERYQQQDTWKENLIFEKDSFELLQDILESAGELEKRADYEDLVTVEYAEKAMKK